MALELFGTSGPDLFEIGEEEERINIQGNGGDDVFNIKGDDDGINEFSVTAGSGNDALNVDYSNGTFDAGAGTDTLDLIEGRVTFLGGSGVDTLRVRGKTVWPERGR